MQLLDGEWVPLTSVTSEMAAPAQPSLPQGGCRENNYPQPLAVSAKIATRQTDSVQMNSRIASCERLYRSLSSVQAFVMEKQAWTARRTADSDSPTRHDPTYPITGPGWRWSRERQRCEQGIVLWF